MNMRKAVLALVLGAFTFVALGTAAYAQRDCGPNSTKCRVHGESCEC